MSKIVKNDPNVKNLIEELAHARWAAEHPALMIDQTVLDLLRRCELVLRTMSEHDDKDV